ncbi:MAG: DUF3179 domain-containing protein [Candidatus Aminicenantes bacterium]|nr:DUF3179 domain-containing protein [Candidatus Aminicenantes bacterium]
MLNIRFLKWVLILGLVFLPYCDHDSTTEPDLSGSWLIPEDQVQDGGPGRDGIPALTNPSFIPVHQATYLKDNDLVVGIKVGSIVRAYSHPILDWHEIVNDTIEGTFFALTYCPLTGSGMAWDTTEFPGNKTFGISGLLYNSNLIPYDRGTDSNWSQMLYLCVNGPRINDEPVSIQVVETTWETWKQLFPQAVVLSTNTGFNRNYGDYPYGDYKTSDDLLFPVSNTDSRLHVKERVHGLIVQNKTKVYPLSSFDETVKVINEVFNDLPLVIVGSADKNFAVSFESTLADGTILTFEPIVGELPVIMIDNEGTKWDIFGSGVSGPRAGQRLIPTRSFISYWFAWAAFYPGAEVYSFFSSSNTNLRVTTDQISPLNLGGAAPDPRGDEFIPDSQINTQRREFRRFEIGRRIVKEWPTITRETHFSPYYFNEEVRGLQVTNLPEKSIVSDIGIMKGDILRKINGLELNDVADLARLWKRLKNENRFELIIERHGESFHFSYLLN